MVLLQLVIIYMIIYNMVSYIKVNRNSKNPRDLDVLIKTEFKGKDSQQSQERFYRLR